MQTPLLIASFPFLLFTIALERACGYPVERSSQDVNKVDPSNSWSIICPLLVEPLSARAFDVTPGKLIGIDHLPSGNIQSWEEPPNAIIEGVGSPREHHKVGARCIMANRSLNDSGSPPYFATTSTNGTIQAPSAMPSSGMKPSQTKAIVGVIIAFGELPSALSRPKHGVHAMAYSMSYQGILAGAIAFFKVASHQNERTRRVRSGGTPPREHLLVLYCLYLSQTALKARLLLRNFPPSPLRRKPVVQYWLPHVTRPSTRSSPSTAPRSLSPLTSLSLHIWRFRAISSRLPRSNGSGPLAGDRTRSCP